MRKGCDLFLVWVKKRGAVLVGRGVLLVIVLEVLCRLGGTIDFPLYDTDQEIGYIPRGSQSGKLFRMNDWVFNSRGMGVKEEIEAENRPGVLLIGDSIVYGGNAYRQSEKLGPTLEREVEGRYKIWPVGAGSWSVLNEISYIERNREVLSRMNYLVWVLNSGDFCGRSQWFSDVTHPRGRPLFALGYLSEKYIWFDMIRPKISGLFPQVVEPLPSFRGDEGEAMKAFVGALSEVKRDYPGLNIRVVLYPALGELSSVGGGYLDGIKARLIERLAVEGIRVYDLREDLGWGAGCYRDFIHPSGEGNQKMSRWIENAVMP